MSQTRVTSSFVAAACLGMAGCAAAPTQERTRLIDVPLASAYADVAFAMTTGSRQSVACDEDTDCPTPLGGKAAGKFALQVRRIAAVLQAGAQSRYPDLAQRVPGMAGGHFDVYVVAGDAPGSDSSADGRIALSAALGAWRPYDDWLAFVIAREMGHVIARHHEENSSASIATSVIMNLLIPGSGLWKSAMSAGGSRIAATSQGDVQTREADAIALELLEAAGFRLRDVAVSLLAAPALRDDGLWSIDFGKSAATLLAAVRGAEAAIAAARQKPQIPPSPAAPIDAASRRDGALVTGQLDRAVPTRPTVALP